MMNKCNHNVILLGGIHFLLFPSTFSLPPQVSNLRTAFNFVFIYLAVSYSTRGAFFVPTFAEEMLIRGFNFVPK